MLLKTTIGIKTLLLTALCSWCALAAWSQTPTEKMLELINNRGNYYPTLMWLEDEGRAQGYLREIHQFSVPSMRQTLEYVEEEHKDALAILQAREEILGKKLVKKLDGKPKKKHLDKQDQILAKRFNDVEQVKKAFAKARETDLLCRRLSGAINHELNTRKAPGMPVGALVRFEYSTNNGFAGFHKEVSLGVKDGKKVVRAEERRMRFNDDKPDEPVYDVTVDDSVFVRVRDMIEEGKLYEAGSVYQPDFMIFDASNWSMDIQFEGGSISSSGYATGPDHADTLSRVVNYLVEVYNALKPKQNPV